MHSNLFLSLVLSLAIFSCQSDQASSGTQVLLDQWFPGQFLVNAGEKSATNADSLALVRIQSKQDPGLHFTVDYFAKKEAGGLNKEAVESAFNAAQANAKPSQELLGILQKNGFKNLVIGMDLKENSIAIQWYEALFTSVFSPRMKHIEKLCAEWAAKRQMAPCKLTVLVMDPLSWGQRFTDIIDVRYLNHTDAWMLKNTIATASADIADPGAVEFLPGSLQLSGAKEMEIRKKVHAEVTDYLRTSQKMEFHVELQAMVNTDWDLRRMDKIRYYFPYCQKTDETERNGSCMGNFDGQISCVYDFKTGEIEVDYK